MAISIKNHEDRITALERKSTQGATLSPVKLWSGTLAANNSLTLESLANYKLIVCSYQVFQVRGSLPVVKGQTYAGHGDDIGGGSRYDGDISWTENVIKLTTVRGYGSIKLTLKEVWGIG